jgi:hypothetical protein
LAGKNKNGKMKTIMLNIFFVVFFISLGNCQYKNDTKQEKGIVYKLEIANADDVLVDSIKINNTIQVLRKRLLSFSVDPIALYYEKSTKQFVIKVKEALENNGRVLLKPCKIEFYECYSLSNFFILLDADKSKKGIAAKQAFLSSLGEASNMYDKENNSPYLMLVGFNNIDAFNKTKIGIQNLYSSQCLLAYQQKNIETKNESIEFYALKNNSNKIEVNKYIDEVKVNFDERGFSSLGLSFNKEGSMLFANLTGKNINNFIAIVVDGVVYMAPRVYGEITGGKMEISGRFELKELEHLKTFIESGYLPFDLKIAYENFEK